MTNNHIVRAGSWTTRPGFTLIEMLVVITGVTVLMGLCVVTLASLQRVQGEARADAEWARQRSRLAASFREDVRRCVRHEAIPASFGPGLERLTLGAEDESEVAYRVGADGALMVARRRTGRDASIAVQYRCWRGGAARIETDSFEGATLVRLVLPISTTGPEMNIEAALPADGDEGEEAP